MVGNHDLVIDTSKIGTYSQRIIPANINNIIIDITYRIDAVYGLNSSGISELVHYVQQCLHTTKERTIWMAGQITNFPVTPEQVKRYWKEDMCWIKGNLRSRKVDAHLFDEVREKKKKTSRYDLSKALDTRNLSLLGTYLI
jgi:hypothetical protein